MAIKGVKAKGDDQDWKRAVEKELDETNNDIEYLKQQIKNINRKINK